jgi:hypothetical protein
VIESEFRSGRSQVRRASNLAWNMSSTEETIRSWDRFTDSEVPHAPPDRTDPSSGRNSPHRQVATRTASGDRRWRGVGAQLPKLIVGIDLQPTLY